ncbi:SIR2-domain-containing protein [Amniculicola lignicola CBS 123094]|uniref:SIR2-domain-containing protein n=1 Tax=Amniculicola lignicola CBS 123094 TaxID=1392246 RepID=A0A6A5WUR6_9PLEO|nr:SIR2-domain-containing protein [Amniculicola lignicola CBS 123094]
MAAAGMSGPVMVQEQPHAPIVDLDADPIHMGAHDGPGRPADAPAAKSSVVSDDDREELVSLLEDIMDGEDAVEYATEMSRDVCTVAEARTFRSRLHEVGPNQFILETITTGNVGVRKLCSAFGVRIPAFFEGCEDEQLYQLLGLAINRELNKRPRLGQYSTIDDAAKLLQERSNIMVITGAGISTSLGIPDFRSKNTGFYSRLQEMGFQEPEQVFDIQNFDEDPSTFYTLAGDILPDLKKWTPTHEFIRLLQDKDKLLTNYTQNIDNVESHAGLRTEKLIQCHGSWATATCRKCKYRVPGEDIFENIRIHKPMECIKCTAEIAAHKTGMKRKRSSNGTSKKRRGPGDDDSESDGAYDIPQPGIMKPDITFFGEALPQDFFDRLKSQDKDKVDLVIVMGTSMKVAPVSEIPNFLPRDVPQIYISRDPIHHINFDINLLGDCDVVVAELARRAGWDLKHSMIAEDQKTTVTLVDDLEHISSVAVRRPGQLSEPPAQKA